MNKKQIIVMWCGIAVTVLNAFFLSYGLTDDIRWEQISFRTILIALVTGGLIYTFRDKKPKDEQANK